VLSAPPGADLTGVFSDTARMTRWHRNSDYGSALLDFTDRYLEAVGPRTTVLILGDARSNNTDPHVEALRVVVERARQVVFLNPEPPRQWGTGDSVAHLYGEVVDMHECANAKQLREFVGRLPV
ncbi:MAG TPA: VWA domain-containing protein, partial [Phycicoccus elongatus]